ncbi:CAP domain-containing protein [Calothrix sp. UHCC 0171]|uniref:CAP domain-containing protein n=1 Tax=Calothrix sp. UHCC 0171 TaxID=3110245 RepID=UPI002B20B999|nr:CAP domain-containing protein [Calothrix sp. UHCC 0171]MEA5573017.1 CAP domain-containing protein [Calothrix sp. UHCC 0171]
MHKFNFFPVALASIITISFCNHLQLKYANAQSLAEPNAEVNPVATTDNNSELLALSHANYLSQLEKEVIVEMNKVRRNPNSYIPLMEEYKTRFQGNRVRVGKRQVMITKEGIAVVNEAIEFLKQQAPVSELSPSQGMSLGARDHAKDQGENGLFGHYGSDKSDPFIRIGRYGKWRAIAGENIAYGYTTADSIVMQLIIDDGVPHRGHRKTMFNPDFKIAGVAIGDHSVYRTVCVITYAGGYEEGVKSQEQSLQTEF